MSMAPNTREDAIRERLEKALQVMREAVDKVERGLARKGPADPGDVLQAFSWGFASACSHITAAMSWRETGHEEALFHAHQNPDPDFGTCTPEPKA